LVRNSFVKKSPASQLHRGNPVKYFAEDTTRKIASLYTLSLFMLIVKQESCEYQRLKSFDLTRPENQIQIYWLRGGRSND